MAISNDYPREQNEHIAARRTKLAKLKELGIPVYTQAEQRDTSVADFISKYHDQTSEELQQSTIVHHLVGRVLAVRHFGKAAFLQFADAHGRSQSYVSRDLLGIEQFDLCKKYIEVGDIIAVAGTAMRTKTGELTLRTTKITLLTKSMRPLPEKFHGLTDVEARYRQRYVDLIVTAKTKQTFLTRSKILKIIRSFFADTEGFLEVETPMMHPIAGGAIAKPFTTHHNALHMDLYLRIAPELYLKRLLVGGFEKVFEINRNFRNEGLSTQHNPEFTMLEFYSAYTDYEEFMLLTERLFATLCDELGLPTATIDYQGTKVDLTPPFKRLRVKDGIKAYTDISDTDLHDLPKLLRWLHERKIETKGLLSLGHAQMAVFDNFVEQHLQAPTFVTAYPIEVSPLAQRDQQDPSVAQRFEFFICGREIANAFNELNDPDEQYQRFCEQAEQKRQGNDEACDVDLDYIRALEYGMPPAAGEGIGIDRLVMLFTDSSSIRDVIFFPQLRSEQAN